MRFCSRLPRQAARLADAPAQPSACPAGQARGCRGRQLGLPMLLVVEVGWQDGRGLTRRATAAMMPPVCGSAGIYRVSGRTAGPRRPRRHGRYCAPLGRVSGRNRRATAAAMVSSPPLRRREVDKAAESKEPAPPVIAPMRAGPPHAGEGRIIDRNRVFV